MNKPSPTHRPDFASSSANVYITLIAKERERARRGQSRGKPAAVQRRKAGNSPLIIGVLMALYLITGLIIFVMLKPVETGDHPPIASFDLPPAVEVRTTPPDQFAADAGLVELIPQEANAGVVPPPAQLMQTLRGSSNVFEIRGVEITQGIQVFNEPENPACHPDAGHPNHIFCNNALPLVAGRHTMLRVYVGCHQACPVEETTIRLRIYKNNEARESHTRLLPAGMLAQVDQLPLVELRQDLERSINFEFLPPPEWFSGPITFDVEAVAGDELLATATVRGDFAQRRALRVAYLPIQYQGATPQAPDDTRYWLRRLFPVPDVEYYRLPVPDLVWDRELSKAEMLQELLYVYWLYTDHNPEEAWPDQLFGWLPQEVYNGGASDPAWCGNCAGPHSGRVAFGGLRPERDIGGPRILVHEVAHNLGARHAWSPTRQEDAQCFRAEGTDIRVDPGWPYAETPHIQEVGVDLYSKPPVIYASSAYDMMAYCADPWISPHTYRTLFDSPLLQPESSPAAFEPQDGARGIALLISGLIYPDGTVSRPEIVWLDRGNAAGLAARSTSQNGDYCLYIHGHENNIIARRCFKAGFIDSETGLATEPSPYVFNLAGIDAAAVGRVTVNRSQSVLVEIVPSANPPQVTLTWSGNGQTLSGRQTITWQGSDADGDPLMYNVLYSPDGGQRWLPLAVRLEQTSFTFDTASLPSGSQALIQVVASDGFHTAVARSDGFFGLDTP